MGYSMMIKPDTWLFTVAFLAFLTLATVPIMAHVDTLKDDVAIDTIIS